MIYVIAVILIIIKQYENADIFSIQVDLFGKWIGKTLGTLYIIFLISGLAIALKTYIQIIQIFIYPQIPSYIMGLLLLIRSEERRVGNNFCIQFLQSCHKIKYKIP